ncbi:hypothetical protein GBAR_LOCUS7117 [Geodia barretti]|uniref:Uncharacterized protein n=1 Tax=Geodia barretti TaxID=519541 RepID=A0AA35WDU2_GEOBA|nr:hypothetical protein GBAR_LOCUS7117 [Geodia barretti]
MSYTGPGAGAGARRRMRSEVTDLYANHNIPP